MDMSLYMKKAKEKIKNIQVGSEFELKGLFDEIEWNKLEKGEKISFGRDFANEVREGNIANIIMIERKQNNHRKYKKK